MMLVKYFRVLTSQNTNVNYFIINMAHVHCKSFGLIQVIQFIRVLPVIILTIVYGVASFPIWTPTNLLEWE